MPPSTQASTSRLEPTATHAFPAAEASQPPTADRFQGDDDLGSHEERGAWKEFVHEHQHMLEYFVAGGLAGATSRTAVSPFERLKILMQVQSGSGGKQQYTGIRSGLVKMWKEEGFKGYMKGNGINVLRIMPYSAVQFGTYESAKSHLSSFTDKGQGHLGTPSKLLAGSLAGITSVCSTYPLDLVRARISIADARRSSSSKTRPRSLGIVGMTMKVYREEGGLKGLYRGCIPTAAGVAPFVALNFALYERFRLYALPPELEETVGEGQSVATKLACGALAGGLSQTITYPFDVIRRKMQVLGMQRSKPPSPMSPSTSSPSPKPSTTTSTSFSSRPMTSNSTPLLLSPSARSSSSAAPSTPAYTYTSGSGALIQIWKREGVKGLYRGIGPNLLKVAPSMGVSFYTYETVLSFIRTDDD